MIRKRRKSSRHGRALGKKRPLGPAKIAWSPVTVSGGPDPIAAQARLRGDRGRTRFPFRATIATPKGTYAVEVQRTGIRFLGWIDR